MIAHACSTLFPYTTLFRSWLGKEEKVCCGNVPSLLPPSLCWRSPATSVTSAATSVIQPENQPEDRGPGDGCSDRAAIPNSRSFASWQPISSKLGRPANSGGTCSRTRGGNQH